MDEEPIICRDAYDLCNTLQRPKRTLLGRIFRRVRSLTRSTIEFPGDFCRKIKWFYQRGQRGWADCDSWQLCDHLSNILPDMLRSLKNPNGISMCLYIDLFGERENCDYTEEEDEKVEEAWNAILDKIIVGFEANQNDWNRHIAKIGEMPKVQEKEPREIFNARMQEWRQQKALLEKEDQALFQEGIQLFAKYFNALDD